MASGIVGTLGEQAGKPCDDAFDERLQTISRTFRKVGGAFDVTDDGIRFYHPGGDLKSIVVETNVHPGFMTDWQQPLVVALTQAQGLSIVHSLDRKSVV